MGIGSLLGSGVRGYQAGVGYRQDQEDRKARNAAQEYGMQRQQVVDQRQDEEYAQGQADREEFDIPEKQAAKESRKMQRDRERLTKELGIGYASQDLNRINAVVKQLFPEEHGVSVDALPDGRFSVNSAKGQTISDTLEQVVFGKEDGSGMGLFNIINPEGVQEERTRQRTRKEKLEDSAAEYGMRGKEARDTARYSSDLRRSEPRYTMDADGNQVMVTGTNAESVMGPDGKPLRGVVPNNPAMAEDGREKARAAQMAQKAMEQASKELAGQYGEAPDPAKVQTRAMQIFRQLMSMTGDPTTGGFGGEEPADDGAEDPNAWLDQF